MKRAQSLLERGFPGRPANFWRQLLATLQQYQTHRDTGPIGTILVHDARDVGILLTIRSAAEGSPTTKKVNLSSWYVDEDARFYAPFMLKAALRDAAVCTDLSPSPEVRALNERLGLKRLVTGSMIVPTLTSAILPCRGSVRPFTPKGAASLGQTDRDLLADHAAMGLICAVLREPGQPPMPIVLMPTQLRGLPGARVIYCPDLAALRRQRGAVARFLARRGQLFFEIEANRDHAWPGTLHAGTRCLVFAKGALAPDAIDHSYTELPFIFASSRRPS